MFIDLHLPTSLPTMTPHFDFVLYSPENSNDVFFAFKYLIEQLLKITWIQVISYHSLNIMR